MSSAGFNVAPRIASVDIVPGPIYRSSGFSSPATFKLAMFSGINPTAFLRILTMTQHFAEVGDSPKSSPGQGYRKHAQAVKFGPPFYTRLNGSAKAIAA